MEQNGLIHPPNSIRIRMPNGLEVQLIAILHQTIRKIAFLFEN
jgi:hypothetical protein